MTLKRCHACKAMYERTTEFFHKNKARPDGLTSLCKTCGTNRVKELKRRSKENIVGHPCSDCHGLFLSCSMTLDRPGGCTELLLWSKARRENELKANQIVCLNCKAVRDFKKGLALPTPNDPVTSTNPTNEDACE